MLLGGLNNGYRAVVIGGSAGSFQGIVKILSALPSDFPLPVIMALHRLKHVRHGFVEALSLKSTLPVVEPEDKESVRKSTVYLAPANYHLAIELGNYFALSSEEMVNNSRPSIDITLSSAAYVYRTKLIGTVFNGDDQPLQRYSAYYAYSQPAAMAGRPRPQTAWWRKFMKERGERNTAGVIPDIPPGHNVPRF